jgi:hypothetical protein
MISLGTLLRPGSFRTQFYRWYRKWKKRSKFFGLTTEERFTRIYQSNLWSAGDKVESTIYSGPGSYGEPAKMYVNQLNDFILRYGITSITDIGCGDFSIGYQITSQNPNLCYHGCDIVKYVIDSNKKKFGSPKIKFYHLDAANESFPTADLLTLRQVLQHLSNREIKKIMSKSHAYKYVIITEHLLKEEYVKRYNKNKPTGPDIRLIDNSGVYINKPPFNLPCSEILSCRLDAYGKEAYLRSFLIVNTNI